MTFNLSLLFCLCRDLRETRQRYDSVGSDMKRKEMQIRELQQRLENGEGCKSNLLFIRQSIFKFVIYILYNICGGGL